MATIGSKPGQTSKRVAVGIAVNTFSWEFIKAAKHATKQDSNVFSLVVRPFLFSSDRRNEFDADGRREAPLSSVYGATFVDGGCFFSRRRHRAARLYPVDVHRTFL